jgi:hypothetical protein
MTVEDLIRILSTLSDFDKTKVVVGPDNEPITMVEEIWIPAKWGGNVIRLNNLVLEAKPAYPEKVRLPNSEMVYKAVMARSNELKENPNADI